MRKVLIGASIDAVGASHLPELMARADCEITVCCGSGLALTSSRFVAHHIVTGRSPGEVRHELEEHLAQHPDLYTSVLIADEPLLRTFLDVPASGELGRLAPLTANPQRLARLLSKVSFNLDAERAGVPIPRFRVLSTANDKPRETWRGVPTVAKAEESLSGSGVRLIQNAEELRDVNATLNARPMLFQEYKKGRVGATAVLYDRGCPKCWFSYLLCNNWPNALSSASALQIFWHPDIEPILLGIGRMTAFDGLCGLDWVLDEESGAPLVLEMNARPTPGLYVSRFAGVNFSRAIAQWMDGDCPVQRPLQEAAGFYRLFPQNLFRAIDDRNAVEFLRTWALAPFHDPKLMLSHLRRVVTHYLPRSWRDSWKRKFRKSPGQTRA